MIYLLHYDTPLHHAQHYLGSCDDPQRIQDHGNGTSRARLPQVFCELGVQFVVSRTWDGGRIGERKLKNQKNARVLCPICRTYKLTVRARQQRSRRAVRKLPFPEMPTRSPQPLQSSRNGCLPQPGSVAQSCCMEISTEIRAILSGVTGQKQRRNIFK